MESDKHPSLGSNISPSQQARTNHFCEKSHTDEVYDHWLALELFKVWEYLQKMNFEDESIMLKIDGSDYVIDMPSLHTAVAFVQESIKEAEIRVGSNLEAFSNQELAFTSYTGRILDRFFSLINLRKRAVVSIKPQLVEVVEHHIIVTGMLQK